ncbi:MAG: hypothetical protein ACAI38_25185 [Myxococcota bacterium]
MQGRAAILLALVSFIELLVLIGGIALVRRAAKAPVQGAGGFTLAGATTMSPRVFGCWLIMTSLALLCLSGYLAARFNA